MAQPATAANPAISAPRVINVDKNAAYPKAIADLKVAGALPEQVELRQVKYLNNLIEQDHRFIKRLTKPGMGFFSFETASRTLQGYEAYNMIRIRSTYSIHRFPHRNQHGHIFCHLITLNWICSPYRPLTYNNRSV
jgi:transposase-like protein